METYGKRILLLSLFCVGLLLTRAEAGSERWKPIAGKDGGPGLLYDPDSVTHTSKDARRVWIRSFNQDGSQRKVLEEVNCAYKIIRDIQVVTERPNKPPQINNNPSEWREIVREPPFGDLLKILCR